MANKEEDAITFMCGGSISVEFDPEVPDDVAAVYNIPINDTAYVEPSELEYPITSEEDFIRKVVATRLKSQ